MQPTVPDTYRDALRGIADREFLKTAKYRDQQWRADRKRLDPQLLLFERLLVRRMAKIGVPMFTSEAMRSPARQAQLKADGRSQLTNGPHMSGYAVDVVHSVHGWEIPRKAWDLVGHVGKEIMLQEGLDLTWGGDWNFYDPAHWERRNWQNYPALAPF